MPTDPFIDPFAEVPAEPPSRRGPKAKGSGAKGALKNMGETAPLAPVKLENMGETGAHSLENFGDTGAVPVEPGQLEHMGETGAHTLDEEPPGPREAAGRLRNMGETGPMQLQNFGDTGKTELQNFGDTGESRLENFGDTSPTKALSNFGDTSPTKSLSNLGDTGALDDPFASSGRFGADDPFSGSGRVGADDTRDASHGGYGRSGDSTIEEPPSQPALRGADEENTYVVVGDQPEPDSQAPYSRSGRGLDGSGRGLDGDDTASESRGTGSSGYGNRSADEEAAPTVDLPQDSLASLSRPGFADDPEHMQKGGSESLTMGSAAADDADATKDLDPADLRAAGESSLSAGDATGEQTADQTGPEGETGDQTADQSGEPHPSEEAEPDFLYGERFSEKYAIPEAPVQPSRGPRTFAIVAVVLVLGAGAAGYWKVVVEPESSASGVNGAAGGTGGTSSAGVIRPPKGPTGTTGAAGATGLLPPPPKIGGAAGATGATGASAASGATGATGQATVIKPPPPVIDEPPPLPAPTNAIDAKLRRALGYGLPIERRSPTPGASVAPGTGATGGASGAAGATSGKSAN